MSSHRVDFSLTHSTQRVCLNGHIISNTDDDDARGDGSAQAWCDKCGASTISSCPSCDGPLKGAAKFFPNNPLEPHAYCIHCGKALPWTEKRLEAMREVAQLIDEFDDTDRATLTEILPDLASKTATPKTEVGIVKMKKLLKKGGDTFFEASRQILVEVLSQAVSRKLGL